MPVPPQPLRKAAHYKGDKGSHVEGGNTAWQRALNTVIFLFPVLKACSFKTLCLAFSFDDDDEVSSLCRRRDPGYLCPTPREASRILWLQIMIVPMTSAWEMFFPWKVMHSSYFGCLWQLPYSLEFHEIGDHLFFHNLSSITMKNSSNQEAAMYHKNCMLSHQPKQE